MGFLRFKSFIGWLEGLDDEALVFRIRIEKMFWKSYHSSLSKRYFFTSSCTGGLAFLTRCLAPYKLTGTSDRSCDFLSKAEIAICLLDPICWIKFDICQSDQIELLLVKLISALWTFSGVPKLLKKRDEKRRSTIAAKFDSEATVFFNLAALVNISLTVLWHLVLASIF